MVFWRLSGVEMLGYLLSLARTSFYFTWKFMDVFFCLAGERNDRWFFCI